MVRLLTKGSAFVARASLRNGHWMTLYSWGNPRYFPRLPAPIRRYFDVDHDARVDSEGATFREQAHGVDARAGAAHLQHVRMEQGLHARVRHHVVQHQLEHLGGVLHAVHAVAGGHREHLVGAGGAITLQPFDHFRSEARHDASPRSGLPAVELCDRTAGGVAAQESVALDQQHLGAVARGCHRGHRAGEAASTHDDVRLQRSRFLVPRQRTQAMAPSPMIR